MAFPATMSEEEKIQASDQKTNTHRPSERFMLRVLSRFGSRNDGKGNNKSFWCKPKDRPIKINRIERKVETKNPISIRNGGREKQKYFRFSHRFHRFKNNASREHSKSRLNIFPQRRGRQSNNLPIQTCWKRNYKASDEVWSIIEIF